MVTYVQREPMRPRNYFQHPFRVPPVAKPRAEGVLRLPDRRRVGYAEFGDPGGEVLLWFHSTVGARRQFPLIGRRAAEELGLRVVVVERPGGGLSDSHPYAAIADWATDAAHVADSLGADRFAVAGLSGGGPYALACAAAPQLSSRVTAVAVLDGIVPSHGPDAVATSFGDFARRAAPALTQLRRPLAAVISGILLPLIPFAHYVYLAYAAALPEGDQRVLAESEAEAMFVDDVIFMVKGGSRAPIDDLRLFGREWGFRLADVQVPVRWWHGEMDHLMPIAAVEATVSKLPHGTLTVRPGDTHLGGFARIVEVLEYTRSSLESD